MDHAALQSQLAGCLAYAGRTFTHAGGSIIADLERVSVEDLGVDVPVQSDAYRITWTGTALTSGTILTSPESERYRIINQPTRHPVTFVWDAIVEPIS